MRGCLLAVLLAASAGCPPPVISPADGGRVATPSLELSAASVDVGSAALRFGDQVRREGRVSVRALEAPLEVEVIARAPAWVGRTSVSLLEPGVWVEVPVALDLSTVGVVRGEVTFSAGNAAVPPQVVTVLGLGTAALDCLGVTPSIIDFGTLNQGCPVRQRPFTITNGCAVPRVLLDAEVTPLSSPFVLSVLTSLPRRLAPGESWSGLADFLGGAPGTHEALLRFTVDGAVESAIGLLGVRAATAPREFSFIVPSPALDLLVVLDSSPSFVPRRAATERQIIADVTDFGWYAGPLRVGVVGTGSPALTPPGASQNDQLDFGPSVTLALADTSSTGDEVERCLETAAQISGNTSFWRAASRRVAVCITDAPEQSADPLAAVAKLADAGVRWDVIGPPEAPPAGCTVESPDDGGHVLFTGALDGSVNSICGSWRLPRVAPAPPPPTRYELPVAPNFPITVWVDGALVPETGWTWEAATRTLVLHTAPGSGLVIRESPSCPQ